MSPRLPMLKARDLVRALKLLGFFIIRQSGSHIFFKHPDGRATIVPQRGGQDIGRGLLRAILNQIEMSPDEFMNYL